MAAKQPRFILLIWIFIPGRTHTTMHSVKNGRNVSRYENNIWREKKNVAMKLLVNLTTQYENVVF